MQRSTVRRRRTTGLVLTVVVVLALGACGAEGDDAAAPTTAPASTSTTTAGTTTAPDDTDVDDDPAARPEAELACPTAGEVADLVGRPVDRTQASGGSGASNGPSISYTGCGYLLEDPEGAIRVQRLTIDDPGPYDGLPFEVLDAHAQAEATEAELEAEEQARPDPEPVTYEGISIGELAAFDTGSALVVDDDPEHPLRITTKDLGLEPAEAAALRLALGELVING